MALCDYNYVPVSCGINTSCVTQVPPSEVAIQPPPVAVTIPGPILSATSEPVAVAQYTPWGTGYGGYPYGIWGGYGSGYGYGYGYGRRYRCGSWYPYCYPGYSRRYSYSSCGPC